MNINFEKIKETIGTISGKVAKKTSEVYDYTKLSIAASGIKNDIDELYKQIGMAIYTHVDEEDYSGEDISVLCDAISMKKQELAEISDKIAQLKNVTVCSECGASVNKESEFCAKCGAKL